MSLQGLHSYLKSKSVARKSNAELMLLSWIGLDEGPIMGVQEDKNDTIARLSSYQGNAFKGMIVCIPT